MTKLPEKELNPLSKRIPGFLHRFLFPALVTALSLANAILVVEIIIRSFFPCIVMRQEQLVRYPQDSEFYRFRTSFYRIEGDDIGNMHNPAHPDYNACGIYGRHIPVRKEPGTFRILFLGDSVTDPVVCCKSPYGYTFVVEQLLNEHNPSLRVVSLNAGVGGFNTEQEAAYLEKYGVSMEPDLIVLAYVNNDNSTPEIYREGKDYLTFIYCRPENIPLILDFGRFNDPLLNNSYALRFLFLRLEHLMVNMGKRPESRIFFPDQDRHTKALERLHNLSLSNGIPLIIVHFPYFTDFSTYESTPHFQTHRRVRSFASDRSIPYLDLLDTYRNHTDEILYLEDDLKTCDIASHPNAEGHRLAGEALAEFLILSGLVPGITGKGN
ncbi:MAG: SGNH/GDSL hydrolase family protein [Candidatus Wallbacteria bacterium]|nr:SGNH/GDSL hydrolase family protein [Candidatus Wallbacteria bacterium]